MTRPGAQDIAGADAAGAAARDWAAVRASTDIQFAPVQPKEVPPTEIPEWLKAIGRFVRAILEPIAQAIGMSLNVILWLLAALAVAALLYLLWRIAEPWLDRPRKKAAEIETDWTPERAAALALLEDADRLAADGKFDEATHLLLRRSVQQIAEVRPDWVHPASTAREIAVLGSLPEAARRAFGVIAKRVEASRYALRKLAEADWQAARGAYADFALAGVGAGVVA